MVAIYADDTTLYSKCDHTSDLLQQLELASELESNLQDMVDWGRKWFVVFNAGKTQLVSFDQSNNTDTIDVKMDKSVLEEESYFKMMGLTFSSKLNWSSYIIPIAKTSLKPLFVLWSFFLLRLISVSINLPYTHVWSTVVMSGLMPLVTTWNC